MSHNPYDWLTDEQLRELRNNYLDRGYGVSSVDGEKAIKTPSGRIKILDIPRYLSNVRFGDRDQIEIHEASKLAMILNARSEEELRVKRNNQQLPLFEDDN